MDGQERAATYLLGYAIGVLVTLMVLSWKGGGDADA